MFLLAVQSDQTLYAPPVLLQPQREIKTSRNNGGSKTHPCACLMRAHANFARSQVGPVRRVFHSPWEELVADHGIVLGDCIIFHFPKEDNHTFVIQITNRKRKNKTRIDTSVSAEAFNHDIEYKLECAILSNGVSLCDEARANLHSMLSTVVLGQELFLCIVYLQPTSSSAWSLERFGTCFPFNSKVPANQTGCNPAYLYCGTLSTTRIVEMLSYRLFAFLMTNLPDPIFGIYVPALKNVSQSTNLFVKLFCCVWWGLRNLR
ncbi:uncharacterized protein LOC112270037 [Brachypodium distachyon]|uniref:uncharacterized protein LOC112270037 n=1 Tax=Brachypodium distachyon TaxID=15368 RepID=UPI000D0D803B|nr:uncharacterized protein LOC112270037 [Brachypodium distachyon]|eukprot:XP_024313450.1 uncharacterized protein LOC112270037 [Brachypodium distachyon]